MQSVARRAAFGLVSLLALSSAASAVEAVATTNVNVRTGPGTTFSIVGQLSGGERVDIRECTAANWCFIDRNLGPDGWVSAAYLTAPPATPVPPPAPPAPGPSAPGEDCSFGFTIGPSGPNLSINCGNAPVPPGPPPPPPPPAPAGDEACFYTGPNYSGTERCYGEGTYNSLPAAINDRISSVRLFGDVQARLCVDASLGGVCRVVEFDTPNLPGAINDRASSARVFIPGPPVPPVPPLPPPVFTEACVYTGTNFAGTERCYDVGVRNTLPPQLNDRISSVRVRGGARVRLCAETSLGGICRVIGVDSPTLPPQIDDRASSLEVFVGPGPGPLPPVFPIPPIITPVPPPAPVTYSTGPISLQQTFAVDLDTGGTGASGADIWYQAVNAGEKYLTPRNGAQLALGDRSNRGRDGCAVASFSGNRIALWEMPVGSYVCARTDQGRISQFRLNGYTGTTMELGYTTWAN